MNRAIVRDILDGLRTLPFFADGEGPMSALVTMAMNMAETEDQVRWVVECMTSGVYEKWWGPHELRAVYCQKYKPKDGIEADSTVYPDGIPYQLTGNMPQLPVPELPALPAGHVASVDPEADAILQVLAEKLAARSKGQLPHKKPRMTTAEFEAKVYHS